MWYFNTFVCVDFYRNHYYYHHWMRILGEIHFRFPLFMDENNIPIYYDFICEISSANKLYFIKYLMNANGNKQNCLSKQCQCCFFYCRQYRLHWNSHQFIVSMAIDSSFHFSKWFNFNTSSQLFHNDDDAAAEVSNFIIS